MLVVGVLVGVIVVSGLAVGALVSRWPKADVATPGGATKTLAEDLRRWRATRELVRRRFDPTRVTGLLLTVAAALVTVGAALFGVLLYEVRTNTGVVRLDGSIARWAADHDTGFSSSVLRTVTELGSTWFVVVLVLGVIVLDRRRLPVRHAAAFLALVVVGQNLVANLAKALVDRDRPEVLQLAHVSSSSFPSGHTTSAAACYAACALVLGRGRSSSTRARLAAAAAAIAAGVASTRILLGVHWFTDTLAGMALGWGWFALCAIAFGGRLLHFGAPVEAAERTALDPPRDVATTAGDGIADVDVATTPGHQVPAPADPGSR